MKLSGLNKALACVFSFSFITACSDSGGSDPDPAKAGYFIDSGVQGLTYSSPSHSGTTGPNGSFSYEEGETVSFSLYGLSLGSAIPDASDPVVTPAILLGDARSASEMETFLASDEAAAQQIINLLVLLQSFDDDGQAENGIYIPLETSIGAGFQQDYSSFLTSMDLTQNSTTFRSALSTKLEDHVFFESSDLVSEEDAIGHFIGSLESLEAVAEYVGRWIMRSGDFGDISAVYTFGSGGDVALVEYDNCPDNLWGSTESLLQANCAPVDISQTFTSSGATINLISSGFTDTCVPLSINSHEAKLTCNFSGSGLGNEIITLQRAATNFDEAPLLGNYRDLTAGSNVGSFSISSDTNGSYAASGESSTSFTFTKTSTSSQLVITPTSGSDGPATFTFDGYIKGSWLVREGGKDVILNSTQNITNANLLKISGFVGIFDANPGGNGECKEVVRFDDTNSSMIKRIPYDNAAGVGYACDYPQNYFEDPEDPEATITQPSGPEEIVSFNSTAMSYQDDRKCYLLGLDEYELNSYYVACETGSNTFDIEIWKPL